MRDVINNSMPYLNDDDLDSIAVYLKSLPASNEEAPYTYDGATATMLLNGKTDAVGAAQYASNCQSCHRETGAAAPPFVPPLAGNPTVVDKDAASLINVVLNGSGPLADIVTFIRYGWANHASAVSANDVGELRNRTDPASDRVVILKMR